MFKSLCIVILWFFFRSHFGGLIGDVMQRICTAAEIDFYSKSLIEEASDAGSSRATNYLKLNKNCNLSSWVEGCEPGWACSVGKDKQVDLKNKKEIPTRVLDCQPCCEGFFCPHGLTCMIRESARPHLNCSNFQSVQIWHVLIVFEDASSEQYKHNKE